MNKKSHLRTWIEIDRTLLEYNFTVFKKEIGKKVLLGGVIKSNAYGHNLYLYAKELERLGIDMLLVDSLVEGVSLRKEKVRAPMLVLGYTLPTLYKEGAKHDIALAVSSFESLRALKRYAGPGLRIHIKVDTGMHRQGFQIQDLHQVIGLIRALPKTVRVEGLFTHFAEAKKPKESARTHAQIREFNEWKEALHSRGIPVMTHASATGGALVYGEAHYDMVRIGIGLYGVWPSEEVRKYRKEVKLKPTLSWRAVVSETKTIEKGERVGYDFTEKVLRKSIIAVIPVGYWHGFPRLLSGRGEVLIRGKRAKVLGRVSMDMIVVDVTGSKGVRAGDIVTLIGKDGREEITAEEMALHAQTTAYEILTRLNPKMERIIR